MAASIDIARPTSADLAEGNERFVQVAVTTLAALPDLRCRLYLQQTQTQRKILYRSEETPLNEEDLTRLQERNVRHLYIRECDERLFQEALRAVVDSPLEGCLGTRLTLVVENHREHFECALRGSNVGQVVSATNEIARDLFKVIGHDKFAVREAIHLLDYDNCTFRHSCNVAVYTASLAKQTGIDGDELQQILTGGLLHDVGKRHIPTFVLNKRSKLTDQERELIRMHPTNGFRELATVGTLNWPQLMMAYQHHEWMNGGGYPVGATGDELHLWSRICAVADVFDALTASRPYREPANVADVIRDMLREAGTHFDPILVKTWAEMVQ